MIRKMLEIIDKSRDTKKDSSNAPKRMIKPELTCRRLTKNGNSVVGQCATLNRAAAGSYDSRLA